MATEDDGGSDDVARLVHNINNKLQVVLGWFELEKPSAALIAFDQMEDDLSKLHILLVTATTGSTGVRAADA